MRWPLDIWPHTLWTSFQWTQQCVKPWLRSRCYIQGDEMVARRVSDYRTGISPRHATVTWNCESFVFVFVCFQPPPPFFMFERVDRFSQNLLWASWHLRTPPREHLDPVFNRMVEPVVFMSVSVIWAYEKFRWCLRTLLWNLCCWRPPQCCNCLISYGY